MTNRELLRILRRGWQPWNAWREENPDIRPDLSRADLRGADLSKTDLSGTNLERADLSDAILSSAGLDLANLRWANLYRTDLEGADLSGAILAGAYLTGTDLSDATLSRANLGGADLRRANLYRVILIETDFSDARIGWTVFGNVNLSAVIGLESVIHMGPSTIGIDTLYLSGGKVPDVFLRGCGVPEPTIEYVHSLVTPGRPIDYYSCFISYSSKNQDFAERLHADLQAKGVRCWFAPEDLKIGDRLRYAIDEAIRVHDKLLLILSETSVESQWVEQEVERALQKERQAPGRTVLFPIRVDEAVMEAEASWANYLRNTRHIGNFSQWKEHDAYQRAFQRLLRDLNRVEGE